MSFALRFDHAPRREPDLFELIAAARARGFGVSVAPSEQLFGLFISHTGEVRPSGAR